MRPAVVCAAASTHGTRWTPGRGDGVAPARPSARLLFRWLLMAFVSLLMGEAVRAQAQDSVASSQGLQHVWDSVAHTVVHPWWTIGLLVFGCFCLFYEMLTPKTWRLAGNSGVACVGLVFAANIAVKEAGWVGVLLLLVGLTLILLEVHIFPGFGAALAGFGVMFAGMFVALGGMKNAPFALPVTILLIITSGIAFLAYLPQSPAWKRMGRRIHEHQALNAAAFESNVLSAAEMDYFGGSFLIGQRGRVLTALRPTGTAEVAGKVRRVVTEGDFLDPGAPVVVTRVEGDRIVVDPVAVEATGVRA